MTNTVNLASEPFRRERAENAVYLAACGFLTLTLIVLLALVVASRSHANVLRAQIAQEQSELEALQHREAQYSSVLSRPENTDVFSTSVFLNELIARRSVSWTKVFQDLGTVLPANVRLQVVRLPQIPAQTGNGTDRVQLDMVVGSQSPEALIELLKRLEKSDLFGSVTVLSQQPPSQTDPLYRYRVMVSYAQRF